MSRTFVPQTTFVDEESQNLVQRIRGTNGLVGWNLFGGSHCQL